MKPEYNGYELSKKDDKQTIIDNLKYEYIGYLGNLNLKQLKAIAESNSFELNARKPVML